MNVLFVFHARFLVLIINHPLFSYFLGTYANPVRRNDGTACGAATINDESATVPTAGSDASLSFGTKAVSAKT